MRVLVTGHHGYIGTSGAAARAGGPRGRRPRQRPLRGCTLGAEEPGAGEPRAHALRLDIRDVGAASLRGFDAVVHLAAISNDPLGDYRPETTYDINHHAAVSVAELAKAAGVPRFLFSSSCSLYGAAGDDFLDETATSTR